MVEFVTILLSLVVGPVEVEVRVGERVAGVVLELDGETVGELDGPPWRLGVDLGERLRPRRLTARTLDADGRELDRATRLLNVFRPPVDVDYALHRNASGWVTMIELSWPTLGTGARPARSAVSIDGQAVAFEDPAKIYPPPLDPSRLHVVEAVVEYDNGVVARDLFGVGGPVLGESSARLTPVPIRSAADSRHEVGSLSARLTANGEPLRVVGVERGDAEIVFVRDAVAASAIRRIGPARATMGALSGARDAQAARVIHAVPLAREEWVRVLDPRDPVRSERGIAQDRVPVPVVSDDRGDFGLFWHLKEGEPDLSENDSGGWLSDAVAVAGSRVASGARRRATVLVLAADSVDRGSLLDPERARAYLEAMRVPFHVWYVGKPAKAPSVWGPSVSVRSVAGMEDALDALRASLDQQRIVWVEGVHLPGEVAIESPATSG